MQLVHYYFKNFKGIEEIKLDFTAHPTGRVFSLVGLNESGKTTVLEAMYALSTQTAPADQVNVLDKSLGDPHDLIPISQRSNFNDSIIVEAGFKVEERDQEEFRKHLSTFHNYTLVEPIKDFKVKQEFRFVNSQLVDTDFKAIWTIDFRVKAGKSKKVKNLWNDFPEDWRKMIPFVRTLLPSVLFFPNFLFEFPDRIYLEEPPANPQLHAFYRTILQDVLDSFDDRIRLDVHVLARAKAGDPHNKRALDSVLLHMSNHISRTVFSNWNRIFKRNIGNKEIIVVADKDEEGRWFVELRLKDVNELYSISNRSLGFRWFFSFLFLTHYRGFRKNASSSILFLLDEPASNLHPSAQATLLESFGNFPPNCSIIYTTHSHHMINPAWLEGAYVVKNEGFDYAEEDNYNAKKTLINLERYREFASKHPDQSNYFQPILDVLDYAPGKLENVPDVVMVEGKNDFYTLKYFHEKIVGNKSGLHLMPGGGSGSLDNVIRLYLGWARNFVVLLDSDTAGDAEKRRYEELFGPIMDGRIFLLRDIDPAWKKELEYVLTEPDRMAVQQSVYPDSKRFNKTHFNRAVQELYLTDRIISLSPTTVNSFKKLLDFCSKQLKAKSN
ncbi:MAG: ATP-binding protein [Acidobacteria bacterium]|nr:ATP-binding protein [Acidobacteriota bacterium]